MTPFFKFADESELNGHYRKPRPIVGKSYIRERIEHHIGLSKDNAMGFDRENSSYNSVVPHTKN